MGIRSEESIALGRIADKLQSLDNTMSKIEKDLHSIDISLGKIMVQNEKNIDDSRQTCDFKIVPDKDVLGEYIVTRNKCESEISKYQQQMTQQVISDMHTYMNKEEN